MATIKRTGGVDFPDKLKALVAGPPKSGKTTLLGTVPGIIIADTEPKANNLASLAHLDVPYVTIESTADLHELHMVLNNDSLRQQAAASVGIPSINAVAIDTMDTLQKIMKRERMESERTSKFVRDDWAWLKEEMTKIIEAFTALPLHVIFTVHLKTQDIGTEDHPQTKILPGLEGAIATDIAGMVGYSLRSFRKEEVDPVHGKYTKYWLQAEGDETYDFLGTRVGGAARLPSLIEPDFGIIYKAAMAGRPTAAPVAPVQLQQQVQTPVQTTGQQTAPATGVPTQGTSVPADGTVGTVENVAASAPAQASAPAESGPDSGPPAQAQAPAPQVAEQAPPAPPTAPAPGQPATDRPADTEPVSDAALQHMKQVYDALSLPFPEAKLRALTLGDARTMVKMWKAVQADHAEGKGQEGSTAESDMADYLEAMNLLPDENTPQAQQEAPVEPKKDGTIPQVKAYVQEIPGQELVRANEVFELERTNANRTSLMKWLESMGASHGGAGAPAAPATAPGDPAPQAVQQPQAPAPEVQTAVQTPAPEQAVQQPAPGVTPEAPAADAVPTEAEAMQAVQEGLGGEVVDQTVNADANCARCGKPVDDPDIAKIALTRFKEILCVQDYIAATRA